MNPPVSRKAFLLRGGLALAATALVVPPLRGQTPSPAASPGRVDKGPPIESERVREFVGAGHSNLEKVKEMLAAQPSIVNATWDWGGGDFETALGGASHMGRPDIAEVLLAANARLDIFAAAMLGKLEIVKAAVAAYPDIINVPGPHKISLIAHAEHGKATAVVEFLNSLAATKS